MALHIAVGANQAHQAVTVVVEALADPPRQAHLLVRPPLEAVVVQADPIKDDN